MTLALLLVGGFVLGVLILDGVRRIFGADDRLLIRLFKEQPVTMIAASTIVGSLMVYGFYRLVGIW